MSTPKRWKKVMVDSNDKSPKNFRWSQPYEDTLLDLLVRESRKGNRPDSTFTATTFRNVVSDFNRIHGTCIMKKHVLSRIKTMKQHFNMFHGAFNGLSGFAWNNETKMFEAKDSLWAQRIEVMFSLTLVKLHFGKSFIGYIMVYFPNRSLLQTIPLENPNLTKFRDKDCHNWDTLLELYGDTRAIGSHATALKGASSAIQRGLHFDDLCLDSQDLNPATHSPNEFNSFGNNNFQMADAEPSRTQHVDSSQQSCGTSRPKLKRKVSLISVMEDGYKTMAYGIRELSMAMSETGEKVAGTKYDPCQNEEIYAAVDALGLEEKYKVKCYCYLTNNPSKAAQIVGASTAIRGVLLDALMNPSVAD